MELTIYRKSQAWKRMAQYTVVRNAEDTEGLQKRSVGEAAVVRLEWGALCQEQTIQKEQEALSN